MGFLPRWLTLVLCASLLTAGMLHAQPSSAQIDPATPADVEADEQTKEQARVLFNEGLQFVEQEDWASAENRFRRVLLLRSSHVVAYNLASALAHLGHLIEAAELLRTVVRDPSAEPHTRSAAEQLLAEIEPRTGILTLRLVGDSEAALVRLDDKPVELSAQMLTLSVDPGEHRVVVERDQIIIASQTVQVGGNAPLQVTVTLELPPRLAPRAVVQAAPRELAAPRRASQPANGQAGSSEPLRDQREDDGDSVLSEWWFWTAVGAVAAGAVVTGVILAGSGEEDPIAGDTDPPFVRGVVVGTMP